MDAIKDPDIDRWAKESGIQYPVAVLYLAKRGLRAIENHAKAGRAAQAKMTDAERSDRMKRAIAIRWAKVKGSLHA